MGCALTLLADTSNLVLKRNAGLQDVGWWAIPRLMKGSGSRPA